MKLLLITLFIGSAFAQSVPEQSYKKEDYPLDWKYAAGEYLIYDCERSHYACVNKDGQNNCREERNFAREKKLDRYPCAPLKKFESKKLCVEENYRVQDLGAKKRFCYPSSPKELDPH